MWPTTSLNHSWPDLKTINVETTLNRTMLDSISHLLAYNPDEPLIFSSGLFLFLFLGFSFVYMLLQRQRVLRLLFVTAFSYYFYYKVGSINS